MEHCRDDKLSLQRTEEITVLAPLYQATTTDCPLLFNSENKVFFTENIKVLLNLILAGKGRN